MTEEQKLQKQLEEQLAESDVKVTGEAAEKMKANIANSDLGGAWLGVGVHEVYIGSVELTQARTGTLGVKLVVENEEGKGEVTMWLSEAALPYTIENVSRLVVHNTADDKKDYVRKSMGNVVSAKELVSVAKANLIEGHAYLSIRESKTQTYTNKNGEEKPSLERNLLPYKPKQTQEDVVKQAISGSEQVTAENLSDLPF